MTVPGWAHRRLMTTIAVSERITSRRSPVGSRPNQASSTTRGKLTEEVPLALRATPVKSTRAVCGVPPLSLVSLIVTTKNSERTLEACLRSARAQAYAPIEIIVVDNRSTDATPQIAHRLA